LLKHGCRRNYKIDAVMQRYPCLRKHVNLDLS
jgi:hypothetical protein